MVYIPTHTHTHSKGTVAYALRRNYPIRRPFQTVSAGCSRVPDPATIFLVHRYFSHYYFIYTLCNNVIFVYILCLCTHSSSGEQHVESRFFFCGYFKQTIFGFSFIRNYWWPGGGVGGGGRGEGAELHNGKEVQERNRDNMWQN